MKWSERIRKADRKVKKKTRDSFDIYIRCSKTFKFSGSYHGSQVLWDENGVSALKAFNALDSMGFESPCSQPYLLMKAFDGKAALNLIIRQWSEGIKDGLFCLSEFQQDYSWLPSWVWEAVRNQAGSSGNFSWYYDEVVFNKRNAIKYWCELQKIKNKND